MPEALAAEDEPVEIRRGRADVGVLREAGMLGAQRRLPAPEHQPEVPTSLPAKLEPDHDPVGGKLGEIDVPGDPEHQPVGIVVPRRGLGEEPSHSPVVDGLDHVDQAAPGLGEAVGDGPTVPGVPNHDPLALEVPQALRQR